MAEIATATFDFERIVAAKCVYVDKTDYFLKLIRREADARYFISRPRRFGKSLMLSTLHAIFRGRADLFTGKKIARAGYDFTQIAPVVHLDMTNVQADDVNQVEANLRSVVLQYVRRCTPELDQGDYPSASLLFGAFLDALAKKSGRVAVLIDEYDAPVTKLFDDKDRCLAVRNRLHDFYIQLKSHDRSVRFLMMTGVSKFTKLSVFSGLNNLIDLTSDPTYAGMLGYTSEEIDEYLRPNVEAFARSRGVGYDEMKRQLLEWYDSYRFSPRSEVRVCNPVSLGKALTNHDLQNYWEATGNADWVYRILKKNKLIPTDMDGAIVRAADLDVCPVDHWKVGAFLYQCGYLTIRETLEDGMLLLGIPNKEIRDSLEYGLLSYLLKEKSDAFVAGAVGARRQIESGVGVDEVLRKTLFAAFALCPYEWVCKDEAEAKRIFLFFCRFIGASVCGERESAKGRADAILELENAVYVLEFKYDKTADEALAQIKEKGYANAYVEDSRPVYLIGVNYNSAARNIDPPKMERATWRGLSSLAADDSTSDSSAG